MYLQKCCFLKTSIVWISWIVTRSSRLHPVDKWRTFHARSVPRRVWIQRARVTPGPCAAECASSPICSHISMHWTPVTIIPMLTWDAYARTGSVRHTDTIQQTTGVLTVGTLLCLAKLPPGTQLLIVDISVLLRKLLIHSILHWHRTWNVRKTKYEHCFCFFIVMTWKPFHLSQKVW